VSSRLPDPASRLQLLPQETEIPAAGVVYTASGLSVGAIYYVYAWMNAGVMTLELSLTTHVTSATAGNVGVEIKSGDDTRSLVGQVFTNAANGNWDDTPVRRLARSWFNDIGVVGSSAAANVITTTSTSFIEATTTRGYLLAWQDEQYHASVSAQAFQSVVATLLYIQVAVNGSNLGITGIQQNATASYQGNPSTSWAATLNEGLNYIAMNWSVSSSSSTGSLAARQMSYTTTRR
jgi:hypothetical protein